MSKPKHTPGPWKAHSTYGRGLSEERFSLMGAVSSDDGFNVAQCEADAKIEDWQERREIMDANAALIAAAPEMLEALEDILSYAQAHGEFGLDYTDDQTLEEVLCALINKAKGGGQ